MLHINNDPSIIDIYSLPTSANNRGGSEASKGYIYIIKALYNKNIFKLGMTGNISKRLHAYNSSCAYPVHTLEYLSDYIENPHKLEQIIHEELHLLESEGEYYKKEWYPIDLLDSAIDYVEQAETYGNGVDLRIAIADIQDDVYFGVDKTPEENINQLVQQAKGIFKPDHVIELVNGLANNMFKKYIKRQEKAFNVFKSRTISQITIDDLISMDKQGNRSKVLNFDRKIINFRQQD